MRTTVNIDDDVLVAAKSLADAKGVSVGQVLSDWGRAALRNRATFTRARKSGFPTFDVPLNAPLITTEQVNQALADEA